MKLVGFQLISLCLDGPETPTITGPTVGRAGYSVIFSCYASSNPPSLYSWYFNGNPVANTSVYITPPLSEDMSGTYTCKAYNNITGRNKTAHKMFTVVGEIFLGFVTTYTE